MKSGYPQVVNVISRFGLIDVLQKTDMTVSYAYSLSKGALHQLTVLMNRDSSLKDVSIYSVDPGPTKTRMGREDAVASPAEVAIKFLELIQRQDPKLGGSYFKIEV